MRVASAFPWHAAALHFPEHGIRAIATRVLVPHHVCETRLLPAPVPCPSTYGAVPEGQPAHSVPSPQHLPLSCHIGSVALSPGLGKSPYKPGILHRLSISPPSLVESESPR